MGGMREKGATRRTCRGYALLDVALALTVFALTVTSLAVLLQRIVDTSDSFARDRLIQGKIQSLITEAKFKPVQDMNSEVQDESLDAIFRTFVEPLNLSNVDGEGLEDLYQLTVIAQFEDEGGSQEEVAQLFLYLPEESQ